MELCKSKTKKEDEEQEQENSRSAPDKIEQHVPPDDDEQQDEESREGEHLPMPTTSFSIPGSSSDPRVDFLPSSTVSIITVTSIGGLPIPLSSPKYPTIHDSTPSTNSNTNMGGNGFSCTRNTSAEPRPCLNITTLSVRSIYLLRQCFQDSVFLSNNLLPPLLPDFGECLDTDK